MANRAGEENSARNNRSALDSRSGNFIVRPWLKEEKEGKGAVGKRGGGTVGATDSENE